MSSTSRRSRVVPGWVLAQLSMARHSIRVAERLIDLCMAFPALEETRLGIVHHIDEARDAVLEIDNDKP